jgi:hypothetical protein
MLVLLPSEVEPLTLEAVLGGGRFCGFGGGVLKLVDKFTINLPWTTRLSVDFLRSRVSISAVD